LRTQDVATEASLSSGESLRFHVQNHNSKCSSHRYGPDSIYP